MGLCAHLLSGPVWQGGGVCMVAMAFESQSGGALTPGWGACCFLQWGSPGALERGGGVVRAVPLRRVLSRMTAHYRGPHGKRVSSECLCSQVDTWMSPSGGQRHPLLSSPWQEP